MHEPLQTLCLIYFVTLSVKRCSRINQSHGAEWNQEFTLYLSVSFLIELRQRANMLRVLLGQISRWNISPSEPKLIAQPRFRGPAFSSPSKQAAKLKAIQSASHKTISKKNLKRIFTSDWTYLRQISHHLVTEPKRPTSNEVPRQLSQRKQHLQRSNIAKRFSSGGGLKGFVS